MPGSGRLPQEPSAPLSVRFLSLRFGRASKPARAPPTPGESARSSNGRERPHPTADRRSGETTVDRPPPPPDPGRTTRTTAAEATASHKSKADKTAGPHRSHKSDPTTSPQQTSQSTCQFHPSSYSDLRADQQDRPQNSPAANHAAP